MLDSKIARSWKYNRSDHRQHNYENVKVRSQRAILWECDNEIIEGHTMEM